MPRHRSPNYPSIGLGAAIELTRRLWDKEHQTPLSSEDAAKGIGHASLNGLARTRLSTLRKYGLIEGRGDSNRVSDLAMAILHPESSAEKADALRKAANRVELFVELADTHRDASDGAIATYLVRRGFSDRAAEQFIKSFRETSQVAGIVTDGYTEANEPPENEKREPMLGRDAVGTIDESEFRNAEERVPDDLRILRWSLPGNREVELRVPGPLSKADIEVLKKYLEVVELTIASSNGNDR